MQYGLYDTEENAWMGTDEGPLLFDGEIDELAHVRARMVDAQLVWPAGRTRPMEWVPQELHRKDEIPVKREALEAYIGLEEGKW